ncbi:MAG: hypothetical protein Q9164_006876, partial [Protoblastenia rupestris]
MNNVLNLYGRAWTFTEDKIPAVSFCDSTIRFAKILTPLNISHGCLSDDVLSHLVMQTALSPPKIREADSHSFPSKSDISILLFRAYPIPSSVLSLSVSDRTATLAAIAAVLSELGYYRKKALVLKDIMSALLPALVQARKDGAAEMGVHPAASLASLNAISRDPSSGFSSLIYDDAEQGMQAFLALVCQTFGILLQHNSPQSDDDPTIRQDSLSLSSELALRFAVFRLYGVQDLKIDVLRSCINICEALPDIAGALHYSASLLRTAGSGIAPGPESSNGFPAIDLDEQVRLANKISRTISAAQHLGLKHLEAEYWEEFLIRGMGVLSIRHSRTPTLHDRSELEDAGTIDGTKQKNPFIYNPFLESKSPATTEPMVVENEIATFEVILQNLYDFDVKIESIILESEGVKLDCPDHETTIGPYRIQTLHISVIPRGPGSLTITNCRVKIRGCRVRTFQIFSEPWALKAEVKGRSLQLLDAVKPFKHPQANDQTSKNKLTRPLSAPKAALLALK